MPQYPFAAAYRLLTSERARERWLHVARSNTLCPYETLRGLHGRTNPIA